MVTYLRILVSCRLYTTIIRQRKKDLEEIEKIEKYSIVRIAYNSFFVLVGCLGFMEYQPLLVV